MDDLLTAVRTVGSQSDNAPESALTIRSSQKLARPKQDAIVQAVSAGAAGNEDVPNAKASDSTICKTPEEALQLLRSQPNTDTLIATLKQLSSPHSFENGFSLAAPGPLQAQMINSVVNSIIPTFWSTLGDRDGDALLACLLNVTGINAVFAKLRTLSTNAESKQTGSASEIEDLLHVATGLFHGEDLVLRLWNGLNAAVNDTIKRELAWKEVVNLLGSGKVISVVAQAEDALRAGDVAVRTTRGSWLAKGAEYAAWLGKNIAKAIAANAAGSVDSAEHAAGKLLDKALSLRSSAPGAMIRGLLTSLVRDETKSEQAPDGLDRLISSLPAFRRRQLLEQTLRWLSDVLPPNDSPNVIGETQQRHAIPAVAALLQLYLSDHGMQASLCCFLGDAAQSTTLSLPVKRACLAALVATAPDEFQTLLEKVMATFSDSLFINHAPILQQESLAQTLLLAAGYLHRQTPMALLMTARSSSHMQGVSNRLDASNKRARWLGMVVAMAMSSLVDKEGNHMNFHADEMSTGEAKWYLGLVKVVDKVGTLQEFNDLLKSQEQAPRATRRPRQIKPEPMPVINGKPMFGPLRPPISAPAQTEVVGEKVIELLDDISDEDGDDLKPYAKPDSDPEDSDEDATLVNRDKARAPVYIRDLMSMLQDDKSHDRFQLGITHAASLVRRKTNFGSEVKDHAEDLLSLLCNLQDTFDTEDFDQLRLQAMIAILLSDVQVLGPWLSRQAFTDGFSIAQRCIMLTALGLGGRELAGFKNEDELNPAVSNTNFPTKRLPPRLHAIYAPANESIKRLESASKSLERQLIQPMALQAADQSTAQLNAVKVRTFSSRLSADNRTKRKPAANQLAKVFGQALFFPLVGRYQQDISAYGSGSIFASAPFLLVTLLKTLALLLHASGPATLDLPQVTTEYWDLLLSLRVQAAGDITVLEAVLLSLLTLLESNTDKQRIAQEHAKQLMETQQWVELVFERAGGGDMVTDGNAEETKIRTLAAGVLVKTRDVVEVYQKQLFGRVVE